MKLRTRSMFVSGRLTAALGSVVLLVGALAMPTAASAASPPSVSSVSPSSGVTAGGTKVTVHGANFSHVSVVRFGAAAGKSLHVASSTSLTVTAPSHGAGVVDVRVVTASGTSATHTADHFTYKQTPVWSLTVVGTTSSSVSLSWHNPADPTFAGVMIRRLTGSTPPTSPTAGTLVTQLPKTASAFTDQGLVAGTQYSYGVFARDSVPHYSVAVTRTARTIAWGSPVFADVSHGEPDAVSCVSSTFCMMVDQLGSAFTYNGVNWSAPTKVYPNSGSLYSVSCASTTFCVAVGAAGEAAVYSSGVWGALTHIGTTADLFGVSCTTSSFCMAVDRGGAFYHYTGAWSAASTIDAGHGLLSVSCVSTTFCMAVDDGGGALTYASSTWSARVAVDPTSGLPSVSCTSATFCVAVDYGGNARIYTGTWSAPASLGGFIPSVSCVSATFCVEVDTDGNAHKYTGALPWVDLGNVDNDNLDLTAISCASATFCMAVDGFGDTVTYDGSTWSIEGVPDPYVVPTGVSCASPTFCVVVDTQAQVAVFNGTNWSAPTMIESQASLAGVSCVSTTFCVAIAGSDAYLYNGSTWVDHSVGSSGQLTSVSCVSSTFCVLVNDAGQAATLQGSRWSQLGGIDAGTSLVSVSCASSTRCVAIDGASRALSFDGTSWSAPRFLDSANFLPAVSCAPGGSCVVSDNDTVGDAVVYDGKTWSTPREVAPKVLSDLSCVSSSFCYGVDSSAVVGFTTAGASTSTSLGSVTPQFISCVALPMCMVIDTDGNAIKGS